MPELADFKDWFRKSKDHFADWREEAREDYAFVANDQWSEEDKAILAEQMRPCITFNRIGPVIDAVVGNEIQNRQEVRYIPRELGDAKTNEILTEAARWFRDQSGAEDEETDAFQDMTICGMGWTNSILNYEDNPDGAPEVERCEPMEMYPDPIARKRNLADARHVFRVKEVARSEAEDMFPDADPGDLHAAWATSVTDDAKQPHDADNAQYYPNELGEKDPAQSKDKVRLVEVQWWEHKQYYRVADPATGQVAEIEPAEHKKLQERAKLLGIEIKSVKQRKKVFYRAFIGAEVLEKAELKANAFTYQVMTGKRDRNKGTYYGLVRQMKDPQRWANKWLSQLLNIMNSNSKGGLLAERGAFENVRKAEESWADPSAITWMRDGAITNNKVKEKNIAQFPAGFFQLTEFAMSSIRDATGVNMELLGMRDANQPGVLEAQRKQAGMTILATLFDSLRRYRKDQGKLMLYYITNYLSDGRLVRIVGDQGAQYVPLVKQDGATEYDIIVDDAPTSPNQKEQVFGVLMQLFPTLSKMGIPPNIWAELIKYSPLPESLTSKVSEMIQQPQQGQQGPSPEQIQAEAEAQAKQAELQMKAQEGQATLMLEQQKAQSANQVEIEKARIQAETEMQKAQLDAQTQITIAQMKAQIDRETAEYTARLNAQATARGQDVSAEHKASAE